MKAARWVIAGLLIAGMMPPALTGCARQVPTVNNPLEVSPGEYDRLFRASIDELRDRGYVVDRHDYRYGTVSARPAGSPMFAELWRKDNTTGRQAWTSTVNYQRRLITITLEPVAPDPGRDQPDHYLLRAEVVVERVSVPTTYATGSTVGRRVIGNLNRVPTEWQERGITGHYWRPVGRDPYLGQRLIDAIVRRSLAPPPPPAPAGDEPAQTKET